VNAGIIERPIESSETFQILGDFCQIVHLKLKPGQKVQIEPGTMCYMSERCKIAVKLAGIGRILMDGSLMKGLIENMDNTNPGYVGITANNPGNIVPVNLDLMGNSIKAHRDAFVAAFDEHCKIKLTTIASSSMMGCCCADVPFFLQEIDAKGWVFLSAHGTIMQKELKAHEEMVIDGDCLVACSQTVTCDAVASGSCSAMCCGGEGMFNTALKGPGLVILCSLPINKLRKLFASSTHQKNPKNKPAGAK